MLTGLKVSDFVEAVAAKTPTPGGGSVSAAVGALGAALGVMAARYSGAADLEGELDAVKGGLLPLVEADAKAYGQVTAARALPKGTDEEKGRRREALQNALGEASEVPLQGMMLAVHGLAALRDLAPRLNRNLASDLAAAARFLEAAAAGCGENVRANAAMIADGARRGRLEKESARLGAEAAGHRARILQDIEGSRAGK